MINWLWFYLAKQYFLKTLFAILPIQLFISHKNFNLFEFLCFKMRVVCPCKCLYQVWRDKTLEDHTGLCNLKSSEWRKYNFGSREWRNLSINLLYLKKKVKNLYFYFKEIIFVSILLYVLSFDQMCYFYINNLILIFNLIHKKQKINLYFFLGFFFYVFGS